MQAAAEDAEFFHAFGQVRGEGALLLAQPGHVRVAEHGHAVGSEGQHLVDGARESLGGLVRQAVDEVHVDAGKAECAGRGDQIARHLERLDAVDGLLHFGIEILNAQAEAIEAQALQALRDAAAW